MGQRGAGQVWQHCGCPALVRGAACPACTSSQHSSPPAHPFLPLRALQSPVLRAEWGRFLSRWRIFLPGSSELSPACHTQSVSPACLLGVDQPRLPVSLQPQWLQDLSRAEACLSTDSGDPNLHPQSPKSPLSTHSRVGPGSTPLHALPWPLRYIIQLSPCETRPCLWVPAAMGLNMGS